MGHRLSAWLVALGVLSGCLLQSTRAQDTTRVFRDVGRQRDTIDTFQPQPYQLRRHIMAGTERIWVGQTRLDTSEYKLDARRGRLWVERTDLVSARDTLFATYRTYPFRFAPVYRRGTSLRDSARRSDSVIVRSDGGRRGQGFDPFRGIDIERSGSIRRGFVSGTNRDVTPESGLQLQLQGDVADSVFVRALITDENTPIQPEGTTQRLQDFDRVFLGVEAPEGEARLGDVDLDVDGGRFGQFTQKVQGGIVRSDGLGRRVGLAKGDATVFGAVSRGQYRKQDIEPLDGVQGPYRLRGKNGEDAIIVIAGSERVYLDGERLTRGQTEDYVIDYVRAEITFTADRLITDDRRITVEFQYSTSRFTRSLTGGRVTAEGWTGENGTSRAAFGATVIRQADGRDFLTAFDLSRQDSLRLVQSGDEGAVRSGARRVPFRADAPYVHYRRDVITTPSGTRDSIFVPLESAPSAGTSVYRVRFTRVGPGQGAYERVGGNVNGVVHEYVGTGEGAYAPIEPLPAPTKQRLVDLTGTVEPVSGLRLTGEWAQSLADENRFSTLDAADDHGQAYVLGAEFEPTSLELGSTHLGTLSVAYDRRRRGAHFQTFDQTRPVEYGRRWNLSRRGSGLPARLQGVGAETIDRGRARLEWSEGAGVAARVGQLRVGSAFRAWRRTFDLSVAPDRWPHVSLQGVRIESDDRLAGIDGTWIRQEGRVTHAVREGAFVPSVEFERERRSQRTAGTDSLVDRSFRFVEVRPGISYERGAIRATGSVEYRAEDGVVRGNFRDRSAGWTAKSELSYRPGTPYSASIQGGYRHRDVTDYFRRAEQLEGTESLILRFEGQANPLDRALQARVFYDAATERSPILRELYVQTRPELGQYVWRDHNDDGVQQIDEFVPETTPNEGTYVRRFVPSDTLDSVVDLQARTRLSFHPRRLWADPDTWWKQWLAHVTTETRVDLQEKSRTNSPASIYRLNVHRFREPGTTVDGSIDLEQRVELFRAERHYGLDATWRQVRGLTERASGSEEQFRNRWEVNATLRATPTWGVGLRGTAERDRVRSEAFSEARSYDIRTVRLRPRITFEPLRTLDMSLSAVYARKRERTRDRRARLVRLPFEITWTRRGRLRLHGTAEVADVDLEGQAIGRAQFELTEGRGPGTSVLWGLRGEYAFGQNLSATVRYDGRAPATAPTVHTLRMQMTASF